MSHHHPAIMPRLRRHLRIGHHPRMTMLTDHHGIRRRLLMMHHGRITIDRLRVLHGLLRIYWIRDVRLVMHVLFWRLHGARLRLRL